MPILSAKDAEEMNIPSPGPEEYWEDSKWASEHFTEIVRKYPDQWVAIVDKHVVAAGSTIADVEKIATEKTGRDEFPIYFAERGIRVYDYRIGI
ncbi:MAG: DUF5678 domain-containing protein [Thermodesulfobacteriota bacterium]|nr:DUF5678 domain-containing protein [Thermodesulfobacteriota bacterium]